MLSDWMPHVIVRDPELRKIIDTPLKYRQTEYHSYNQHTEQQPEYPALSIGRMLDIERSLRDRGRGE